jgi:hypothetical protein
MYGPPQTDPLQLHKPIRIPHNTETPVSGRQNIGARNVGTQLFIPPKLGKIQNDYRCRAK